MHALTKLFQDELADLYSAEQQILQALPKLITAATEPQLKKALQDHRKATEGHVKRLEEIFRTEGKPAPRKCKGMAGLLAEGNDLLRQKPERSVMDAGIIGIAQRVEHYEIAAYGTTRAYAEELGRHGAVALLQETLDEEKEADELLSQIAEAVVNSRASQQEFDTEFEDLGSLVTRGGGVIEGVRHGMSASPRDDGNISPAKGSKGSKYSRKQNPSRGRSGNR